MPIVETLNPGQGPYREQVRKFGRVAGVGAVETIVWDGANGYNGWLDDGVEKDIQVVSDSVADTPGNAGAQYVQFTGQGIDGIEKTYSMTLNGTTPVLLSATDTGVLFNCIYTAQCNNIEDGNQSPLASDGNGNAGTITISAAGTGEVMAIILPNLGRTQMMIWRCPSNYFGRFQKIDIYPTSGKPLVAKLMARDNLTSSWICVGQIDFENNIANIMHPFIDYISPGTDICLIITPSQTGTNCSAQMWIDLEPLDV